MPITAKQLAEKATFQAFANGYIREIDSGVWHSSSDWRLQTGLLFEEDEENVLELQLSGTGITLAVGTAYRSIVGRHVFTKIYQKLSNALHWQKIDLTSAVLSLIDNIYARDASQRETSENKIELLSRTLESLQIMQHYLAARLDDPTLDRLDYISTEQSLLFGHWLHPTPKSRQGIQSWQHKSYTPELQSKFQLHYFAVSRGLLKQNSLVEESVEQIINQMAEADSNEVEYDKQLVPVHPLQAQWLLHQDNIQQLQQNGLITDLGPMGKRFTPTSSVRTLYCDTLNYMIKLSIPVKITNSLRKNMAHELEPGLNVGKLFYKSKFSQQFPQFVLIEDPAFITVNLPHCQESGFETIIRKNPFVNTSDKQQHPTLSIAALVQEPILAGTHSRIAQQIFSLATDKNIDVDEATIKWFNCYWHCAIEPAIILYDRLGIGLEAHQQNSLLTINDNLPSRYFYRDNQGYYLSEQMRDQLLAKVAELKNTPDLFYDDNMIADRFGYYLFVNQLFSIIGRCGQDSLIEESRLLKLSYLKLRALKSKTLRGVGINFVNRLFSNPTIPCKGNLLTRVEDVDELEAEQELAVYTTCRNPFYDLHRQSEESKSQVNEVSRASA